MEIRNLNPFPILRTTRLSFLKKIHYVFMVFQVKVLIFQYIEGRNVHRIKVEDIIQNVAPKAAALVPQECRNAILNNVSKIVKA